MKGGPMRWMAMLVAVAACRGEGGDGGGGVVPVDDTAEVEGDEGGLVWVDANGQVVDGVVYLGDELSYVDENGFFWWLVYWDTASPQIRGHSGLLSIDVYADPACTEPWTTAIPAPRVVAEDPGVEWFGRYFVAQNAITPRDLNPSYSTSSGDCAATGAADSGVPLTDLLEVTPPPVTWAPPLHPEWR